MRTLNPTSETVPPVTCNSFENLLQRAQSGEERAFSELYALFRPRVAKFLFNSTGDYELADELSNDTFLRAHRSLGSLEQCKESSFLSFLFHTAANLLCDYRRRKKLSTAEMDDDYWGNVADSNELGYQSLEDGMEVQERSQMLRRALAELPPEQANLISLSHFDELTANQIADILDKPSAQATRAALHRAMQQLRKVLVSQGYFTPAAV